MGRSGVKAVPAPRSFKPFWSSDDKIDTTRGKRRLELPQNRQETSSGASAAADGGSTFRWRIVAIRHDAPLFEPHFNHRNWVRKFHSSSLISRVDSDCRRSLVISPFLFCLRLSGVGVSRWRSYPALLLLVTRRTRTSRVFLPKNPAEFSGFQTFSFEFL